MNDFLSKPFEPRTLIDVVRRHVASPGGEAAAAVPAARASGETGWPDIEGIDVAAVMERLDGNLGLFTGLLARLFKQYLDSQQVWSCPTAASMHGLRGAAGMLGARGLQHAAEAAEEALQADDAADSAEWLNAVRAQLLSLREAAATLIAAPPGQGDAGLREAVRWDVAAQTRLVELLHANDLAGLDLFERLKPALRSRLGEPLFLRLQREIDALRFAEAAELLRGLRATASNNP